MPEPNRAYLIVIPSGEPEPMHALWLVVAKTAAKAKAALYRYWQGEFGWDDWDIFVHDLCCVRSLGVAGALSPGVYTDEYPDLWELAQEKYAEWSSPL